MSDELEAHLPTLERARALGLELPESPPTVERRLAAVTVVARAQTRQSIDERMEISVARAEKLPPQAPPVGEEFVTATHRYLAQSSNPKACSTCAFKPGFAGCTICGATGRIGDQNLDECMACEGKGWVRCATCDGSRKVVDAVIRRVEDHDYALRHTFVPEGAERMSGVVVQEVVDREPPEELRFDLDARTAIAPYRSADDVPRQATFLGYEFGNAIELARRAVEHLTLKSTLVRCDVQSWAWPFAFVQWEQESVVLISRGAELVVFR
ncbi:MAG: hypothetical protein ACXWUE_40375 [Polyangiales bacterium]